MEPSAKRPRRCTPDGKRADEVQRGCATAGASGRRIPQTVSCEFLATQVTTRAVHVGTKCAPKDAHPNNQLYKNASIDVPCGRDQHRREQCADDDACNHVEEVKATRGAAGHGCCDPCAEIDAMSLTDGMIIRDASSGGVPAVAKPFATTTAADGSFHASGNSHGL